MKRRVLFAVLVGASSFASAQPSPDVVEVPKPPMARKVARTEKLHGEERQDEYFWLRERKSPEVRSYLESENAFTDGFMKDTAPLQKKLYDEILGRIQETDLSVPYRDGDYFYYSRTEQGKQYPIYCRKKGSLSASEEIILDENELANGKTYFALGGMAVSEDHKLLAYSTDYNGSERFTVHVKEIAANRVLPDQIPD